MHRNADMAKFISFNDSQRLYCGMNGHISLQQRTLENQDLTYLPGNAEMQAHSDIQFIADNQRNQTQIDPHVHVENYACHENQPQSHLWPSQHLHMTNTNSSDYAHGGPQSSCYQPSATNGQNLDFQAQRFHPANTVNVYQNMPVAQITDGSASMGQSANAKMSAVTSP